MECHLKKKEFWKVRFFERTPAIRNSGKESPTHQKRWQKSKNDPYRFDL
jgi:hypothetical protein